MVRLLQLARRELRQGRLEGEMATPLAEPTSLQSPVAKRRTARPSAIGALTDRRLHSAFPSAIRRAGHDLSFAT